MPSFISRKSKIVTLALFVTTQIWALELPNIFSDNMVLQCEMPVRIWGKGKPGATVEVYFAGQKVSTQTGPDGKWVIFLEPLEVSFEESELKVACGDEERIFRNILVGEVWLGSGQSNMQWSVEMSGDSDILLLGANDPYLRLHKVNYAVSREPLFSDRWNWVSDKAESTRHISSVAYQFARDMRATLQVPVGIINASVGGTPSIAWTRGEAISQSPQLQAKDDEWEAKLARYDEDLLRWEKAYAAWLEEKGIKHEDYNQHRFQGAPWKPEAANSPNRPASLANGMIAPIAGYSMRGVIWYQGEEDAKWDPANYDQRLKVMIEDWRQWWGKERLPFGIVQLANLQFPQKQPTNGPWANIRECQRRVALSDPMIGLVVTTDIGEANDIHPRDKFTVARRLSRWALTDVYGKLKLAGGPEIESAVKEGSTVLLRFNQTGEGLHLMDAHQLGGFTASDSLTEAIGETDFYFVKAHIRSKAEVSLDIPAGKNPVRIRYGWQSNPIKANLSNKERLPASPFEIEISR